MWNPITERFNTIRNFLVGNTNTPNYLTNPNRVVPKPAQPMPVNLNTLTNGPLKMPVYKNTTVAPNWNSEAIRAGYTAAQQYGIPANILLSQMAMESSRGMSSAARNKNNYFGYQAYDNNPSGSTGFDSPLHSAQAYGRLISQDPRYKRAYSVRNDPYKMMSEIAKIYASDPNYYKKVTNTPEWRTF